MTKYKFLEELEKCFKSIKHEDDWEPAMYEAHELAVQYINDPDITKAFGKLYTEVPFE